MVSGTGRFSSRMVVVSTGISALITCLPDLQVGYRNKRNWDAKAGTKKGGGRATDKQSRNWKSRGVGHETIIIIIVIIIKIII